MASPPHQRSPKLPSPRRFDPETFGKGPIQVRLGSVEMLFNPLDPAPFGEQWVDEHVSAWVEEWATEIDSGGALQLEIHVPDATLSTSSAASTAIHEHFSYLAWQTRRKFKALLRDGAISLAIGLVALTLFSIASRLLGESDNAFIDIVQGSLAIMGWVSMWRPLEIFLFDWWPIRRRYRIQQRLAAAHITFPTTNLDAERLGP